MPLQIQSFDRLIVIITRIFLTYLVVKYVFIKIPNYFLTLFSNKYKIITQSMKRIKNINCLTTNE